MSAAPSGDAQALHAAGRRVGMQAAVLVAVVLLLLVTVVTTVVLRQQAAATDDLLRSTAQSADDVGDPPPGAWIVLTTASGTTRSPGIPEALARRLSELGGGSSGPRTVTAGDERYRVVSRTGSLTPDDGDGDGAGAVGARGKVQVAVALSAQEGQRDRLLRAMVAAAVVGLALAGLVGAAIGRRAVRPLAEALLLQRRFVADASHELRTPLTLLSTRAQLLKRSLAGSPALEQDAAAVAEDIRVLSELVDDLLVAADPRREDVRVPVDLGELVGQVADGARAHAAAGGVELRVSRPGAGPVVPGATAALRRAVVALVDNAVDHTPAGGCVRLDLSVRGRSAVLRVSDSGPGVPEQERPRVLQRFASGGQRAGRRHYGLGLALTHDVVERHGGTLRLLPSGSGAAFEVELPGVQGSSKADDAP